MKEKKEMQQFNKWIGVISVSIVSIVAIVFVVLISAPQFKKGTYSYGECTPGTSKTTATETCACLRIDENDPTNSGYWECTAISNPIPTCGSHAHVRRGNPNTCVCDDGYVGNPDPYVGCVENAGGGNSCDTPGSLLNGCLCVAVTANSNVWDCPTCYSSAADAIANYRCENGYSPRAFGTKQGDGSVCWYASCQAEGDTIPAVLENYEATVGTASEAEELESRGFSCVPGVAGRYNCICVGGGQYGEPGDRHCPSGGAAVESEEIVIEGLSESQMNDLRDKNYSCVSTGNGTYKCTCSGGKTVNASGICAAARCCCKANGSPCIYADVCEATDYPFRVKCGTSAPTTTNYCYQCNSDATIFEWRSNGDADSKCSGGYTKTNKAQADCKAPASSSKPSSSSSKPSSSSSSKPSSSSSSKPSSSSSSKPSSSSSKPSSSSSTPSYACYQCKNNATIYEWRNNGNADSKCSGGYNKTNKTQAQCKAPTSSPSPSSNVDVNPPTGSTGIIVAWIVGILAIGYSFWYFKKGSIK